jgi:hypothetical protein
MPRTCSVRMAASELLDRDRELRAVDAVVAQAAEGGARLVLIERTGRGSPFAATAAQIFRVAKFFGTQDAVQLRALKARVDPDGTVVANHPV